MPDEVDIWNEENLKLEQKGYRIWSDNPGYTIKYLDEMLKRFGLKLEVLEKKGLGKTDLYFRVVSNKQKN